MTTTDGQNSARRDMETVDPGTGEERDENDHALVTPGEQVGSDRLSRKGGSDEYRIRLR